MESAQGFISTMQIAPSFNSASLYAFAVVIHCRYSVPTKRLHYFIEVTGFPLALGTPVRRLPQRTKPSRFSPILTLISAFPFKSHTALVIV